MKLLASERRLLHCDDWGEPDLVVVVVEGGFVVVVVGVLEGGLVIVVLGLVVVVDVGWLGDLAASCRFERTVTLVLVVVVVWVTVLQVVCQWLNVMRETGRKKSFQGSV
jgi:hypothetical protein